MTKPTQAEIEAALKALRFINDNTVAYPNPYHQADGLSEAFTTIETFISRSQPEQQEAVGEHPIAAFDRLMTGRHYSNGRASGGGDWPYIREDDIDTVRVALTATKPAGWREVRYAPSDCDILLYCPRRGISNEERMEVGYYRTTEGGTMHSWATHWQPLPAPPAEDGEA